MGLVEESKEAETILEFGTPRENEQYTDGGCGIIIDTTTQLYAVYKIPSGLTGLFSGGLKDGEEMRECVLREVREESGLYDFAEVEYISRAHAHYYHVLKKINRVADVTCFFIKLRSNVTQAHSREAHETFELVWMTPIEILQNWSKYGNIHNRGHWIYFLHKAVARTKELGWDTETNIEKLKTVLLEK